VVFGGGLRESIDAKVTVGNGEVTIVATADVQDENGRYYARYVEFGTYKDAAQPFMYPAMASTSKRVNSVLKRHLREVGVKNVR
jgi:HK97 gp10 family phage protein